MVHGSGQNDDSAALVLKGVDMDAVLYCDYPADWEDLPDRPEWWDDWFAFEDATCFGAETDVADQDDIEDRGVLLRTASERRAHRPRVESWRDWYDSPGGRKFLKRQKARLERRHGKKFLDRGHYGRFR